MDSDFDPKKARPLAARSFPDLPASRLFDPSKAGPHPATLAGPRGLTRKPSPAPAKKK